MKPTPYIWSVVWSPEGPHCHGAFANTPAKSQDVKEEILIFRIKNYFLIKCTRFALVEI